MRLSGLQILLVLISVITFKIAMATDSRCVKDLKKCPSGHFMTSCADGKGHYCAQCPEGTFQPDENRYPDQCRLMRYCNKPNMEIKTFGSKIKDAECTCTITHHFEGDDQRACVLNNICEKGRGQGPYGECEMCISKKMYSDRRDNSQRCLPLTICKETNRCTTKPSNGTSDNVCGVVVDDISKCPSLLGAKALTAGATAGIVVGVLVLIILVFFVCIVLFRRRDRKRRQADSEIPQETIDAAVNKIVEFSKKDDVFRKKVSQLSDRRIQDTIGRQNWALAQHLFKNHPHKYEIIVQKYEDAAHPDEVKGYLKEWHEWTLNSPESFGPLVHSLQNTSRNDIVLDICRRINSEAGDISVNIPAGYSNGYRNRVFYLKSILPCTKRQSEMPSAPTNRKNNVTGRNVQPLLNEGRANNEDEESNVNSVNYRPQPSAPVLSGDIPLERQESLPIQASS